jgi:hypothetical protein
MQYLFLSVMFTLCILGMVLTMLGLLVQDITLTSSIVSVLGFIFLAWCFADGLIDLEKRG